MGSREHKARYEHVARLFLAERERSSGLGLDRLSAADVSVFLARECPRRSIASAQQLVTGLRALLRYLHVAGVIELPLRWAVPAVADRRDSRCRAGWNRGRSAGYGQSRSPHPPRPA